MSLWTPDGEHVVPPKAEPTEPTRPGPGHEGAPPAVDEQEVRQAAAGMNVDFDSLTDEQKDEFRAVATEMAEARQRIADTPAAVVIANHAMGLYELAAIHLGQQPPNLAEARDAIDGLRGLLEALPGRLGDNEPTLTQAINQLQMAFVQLSEGAAESTDPEPEA